MTATTPKQSEIANLAEDAAKHVAYIITGMGPNSPGTLAALEDSRRFIHLVGEATRGVFRTMLSSKFGYFMGKEPNDLPAQKKFLEKGFLNLTKPITAPSKSIPEGAYGWFLIPDWRTYADTYTNAVQKVLGKIKTWRPFAFTDYTESLFADSMLKQTERTTKYWDRVRTQQADSGGYVIAAQLGPQHRNKPVRQVVVDYQTVNKNESGLDLFTAAIIVLGHLEYFDVPRSLVIACPGDRWKKPGDEITDSYVPALCLPKEK